MLWLILVGVFVVLLVSAVVWGMQRISRRQTGDMPLDVYRLLVAWRASQCKAEIRAASAQMRRQLWTELDEIDRRERGQP